MPSNKFLGRRLLWGAVAFCSLLPACRRASEEPVKIPFERKVVELTLPKRDSTVLETLSSPYLFFLNGDLGFVTNLWFNYNRPNSGDFLYAKRFIYRTEDAGLTWTPIEITIPNLVTLQVIQPLRPDFIYGSGRMYSAPGQATKDELFLSRDRGNTWAPVIDLPNGGQIHWYNERIGFRSYLEKTTDGGKTWRPVLNLNTPHALHFATSRTFYISGGVNRDGVNSGFLFRSDNAGDTWQVLPWSRGAITSLQFISDEEGFIACDQIGTASSRSVRELLRTQDKGQTWQLVNGQLPDVGGRILFVNAEEGFLCTTFSDAQSRSFARVYFTPNGGRSWQVAYSATEPNTMITGQALPSSDQFYVLVNQSKYGDPSRQDKLYLITFTRP